MQGKRRRRWAGGWKETMPSYHCNHLPQLGDPGGDTGVPRACHGGNTRACHWHLGLRLGRSLGLTRAASAVQP